MAELRWYEGYPPRDLDVEGIVALLRPLAHRGRHGMWRTTPVVVFECWIRRESVRYLVGLDARLSSALPHQLKAQLPGLSLVAQPKPARRRLTSAMTIRSSNVSYTLRLDAASAVSAALTQLAHDVRKHESIVVQWVIGPSTPARQLPTPVSLSEALGLRERRKPDATAQRVWRTKIQEPLFAVQGRVGALAADAGRATSLERLAINALSLVNGPHARLVPGRPSATTAHRLSEVVGSGRTWSSIVNARELAQVLGWPVDGTDIPGCGVGLLGRPPSSLLSPGAAALPTEQVPLGDSLHPADRLQLVSMPISSLATSVHILGPTGSGKSSLAAQMILAHAAAGRSVLVVEPRGDLVADVLARLATERRRDVVLIEPRESGPVVGFNPLAGSRRHAERRADELLHLFRREFGSAIGPRSSDVLLHALTTAARLPDGTITDVPILLTNAAFRRRALAQVGDDLVLRPYWSWFDGLSDAGQVISPVLNKTRVFTSRPTVRRLLSQATPRFNLDELFTNRRIVLVNLNRGLVGPLASRLIGALLLHQLWQTIQRRGAVPPDKRHLVSVVVDEWQDFIGALDFAEVTSQSRGLGVSWTVCHQDLSQLTATLRAACLANVRSRVAFRPAQGDAKALVAVFGRNVRPTDLEQLGAYEACVRLQINATQTDSFVIRTRRLPEPTNDVAALRREALQRYGVDGDELDQALRARWHDTDSTPDGPVGVARRGGSS